MPEGYKPVRVHIRPMQLRLSVIGFNKAIVSFQIAQLSRTAGGLKLPEIGHTVHVVADLQLYMALALSFLALLALIVSSEIDETGGCTHWSLIAGDLLMYMAVAHTLSGLFGSQAATIETVGGALPHKASEIHILKSASSVTGACAWFLATYVGPIVSLVRSPFKRRNNIALGIAYLLVLLVFSWLTAQTLKVESAVSSNQPGMMVSVLRELVQPLRW